MKSITISVASPANYDKIRAIKALRTLAGLGLKEAKDVVEASHAYPTRVEYEITALDQQRFIDCRATETSVIEELRQAGYNVVVGSNGALTDLRKVAHVALDNGEFGLAVDIINLLQRYS